MISHLSVGIRGLGLAAAVLFACVPARGEFEDPFEGPLVIDATAAHGWAFRTGDGNAVMDLTASDGAARIAVDATHDRRGIWWAFIRREITPQIDLAGLAQPGTELRVEARVRTSHAPRRINLHLNTQRTTDFHGNLLEFDLPTAGEWHTVSMTTEDFDGRPGDQLYVQLALMDWGLGRYRVDVDYVRVDLVDPAHAGPDLGGGLPYHPPVPAPSVFRHVVHAAQSATIDRREPDANLRDWAAIEPDGTATPILTVNGTQSAILRWDLQAFAGRKIAGSGGLLELTTHSVQRRAERTKDFGMIRVVEILDGDSRWQRDDVTYQSLLQGRSPEEVFNPQMIIDVEVADQRGERTLITLSPAVLQRLIDGRTRGIVLLPLGSINAAFDPGAPGQRENAPTLRFNVRD
ncbi:hypothetical protein [Opitutus terrae]|nr:hypothetical protein [Opitutus terrae]